MKLLSKRKAAARKWMCLCQAVDGAVDVYGECMWGDGESGSWQVVVHAGTAYTVWRDCSPSVVLGVEGRF